MDSVPSDPDPLGANRISGFYGPGTFLAWWLVLTACMVDLASFYLETLVAEIHAEQDREHRARNRYAPHDDKAVRKGHFKIPFDLNPNMFTVLGVYSVAVGDTYLRMHKIKQDPTAINETAPIFTAISFYRMLRTPLLLYFGMVLYCQQRLFGTQKLKTLIYYLFLLLFVGLLSAPLDPVNFSLQAPEPKMFPDVWIQNVNQLSSLSLLPYGIIYKVPESWSLERMMISLGARGYHRSNIGFLRKMVFMITFYGSWSQTIAVSSVIFLVVSRMTRPRELSARVTIQRMAAASYSPPQGIRRYHELSLFVTMIFMTVIYLWWMCYCFGMAYALEHYLSHGFKLFKNMPADLADLDQIETLLGGIAALLYSCYCCIRPVSEWRQLRNRAPTFPQ